jgi:hypothetical protein
VPEWLDHPGYVPSRDRLIVRFREKVPYFHHLRPVIFLCGGAGSKRRDAITAYIRHRFDDFFVFYAEEVWAKLGRAKGVNSLEMEHIVAELSDLVIIIVESGGTIAELGAFAGNPDLRKKLLPICDIAYKNDDSFINTGPLSWVDSESDFSPSVFCRFDLLLDAFAEVEERIERIPRRGRIAAETTVDVRQGAKRLLLLLSDIVGVIGPTTERQCRHFVDQIHGGTNRKRVKTLLGLGVSLGLFEAYEIDGEVFYFRALAAGNLEASQTARMFSLSSERARVLAAMQKIPASRSILDHIAQIRRLSRAS